MKPKEKTLLARVGVAFLLTWFIGDVVLGAAVGNLRAAAQREASDLARSNENRRRMGNYATYRGGGPKHGLVGVELLHAKIGLPLRVAGIAGLCFLVGLGPFGSWAHKLRPFYRRNPRALFATILILISASMFGIAFVLASRNSTAVARPVGFATVELEKDRRERTLQNPPSHYGNASAVRFGSERSEKTTIIVVRESVRESLDVVRLVASVVGAVGVAYGLLSLAQMPPTETTAGASASAEESNARRRDGGGEPGEELEPPI